MDPSTFRIMFDLYNTNGTAANRLRPIGGPWSFFSRMRILAGGQILEDIDMYNRVHEMFNNFINEGSRYNDFAEGFGAVWEGFADNNALTLAGATKANVVYDAQIKGIPGLSYQTVMFKPLSGIFNQTKYLSLRFMPLTMQLSLVDNFEEPIVSNLGYATTGFTNAATSTIWQIQNVQAKCDIIALDSGLNESYIKLLEDRKNWH